MSLELSSPTVTQAERCVKIAGGCWCDVFDVLGEGFRRSADCAGPSDLRIRAQGPPVWHVVVLRSARVERSDTGGVSRRRAIRAIGGAVGGRNRDIPEPIKEAA